MHPINPVEYIWTDSAFEWINLSQLRGIVYPRQPDSFDEMLAKFEPPAWD